jgi:anti-sigma factor RsiW
MSAAATYMCRQFVEDVTAYLEGALPESVVVIIEGHLADCPHCREYLREMRLTVAKTRALDNADVEAMPAEVRDRLMQAFRERDS